MTLREERQNTALWEYSGIEDVADVLAVTNPRVGSAATCMEHIRRTVERELPVGTLGYVATLGWCVTGYNVAGGGYAYKVTLEAWGVKQHMEMKS